MRKAGDAGHGQAIMSNSSPPNVLRVHVGNFEHTVRIARQQGGRWRFPGTNGQLFAAAGGFRR